MGLCLCSLGAVLFVALWFGLGDFGARDITLTCCFLGFADVGCSGCKFVFVVVTLY